MLLSPHDRVNGRAIATAPRRRKPGGGSGRPAPTSRESPVQPSTKSRARMFGIVGAIVTATAGLVAAGIAVAGPANAVASSGGCAAVSIITARASTEAAGEGVTGALVTQVVNSSTQTVSRASVSYPATLNNYANSSLQGI